MGARKLLRAIDQNCLEDDKILIELMSYPLLRTDRTLPTIIASALTSCSDLRKKCPSPIRIDIRFSDALYASMSLGRNASIVQPFNFNTVS